MFIVSRLLDTAQHLLTERQKFQLLMMRMERWRTFESAYFMLDAFVDRSRAALDIGGNEGYYAGKLARLTSPVHCFEPIPWFAERLARRLPKSVVVHPVAVSNHAGTATLRIPYRDGIEQHGTTTIEPQNRLNEADRVREVSITTVRLDDVVSEPVGFIKIDVEGHEMAVLEGATGIIDAHRPVLLLESERRHHPDAPDNVFRFLQQRGYAGLAVAPDGLRSISGFSVERHQMNPSDGPRYLNNFLFFPNLDARRPHEAGSAA